MKKRSLVALALMAMVTLGAVAQQPGRQGRMTPEHRIEKLTEMLDLTPKQVAQIKVLNEKNSDTPTKGKRPSREQMQKQQREQQAQLKQILTADQYAKFEKMMKNQQGGARKNRPE